jgi:hypothetical protein
VTFTRAVNACSDARRTIRNAYDVIALHCLIYSGQLGSLLGNPCGRLTVQSCRTHPMPYVSPKITSVNLDEPFTRNPAPHLAY